MVRKGKRRQGINQGTFMATGLNGGRGMSQFAFALSSDIKEYTLQLFPSDGTAVYSLFPGISPGMVIRVTGLVINIASSTAPGAFQWIDMNCDLIECNGVAGALPTTIVNSTNVQTGEVAAFQTNDGTRNSTCVTIGAYGQTVTRVPMATNAQYTTLGSTTVVSKPANAGTVIRGVVLGSLLTTSFEGFCTITLQYQVGAPRVLMPTSLPIGAVSVAHADSIKRKD